MIRLLNIPRLILEIIFIVACAEVVVMFVLPVIAPGASGLSSAVLDATLLSVMAGPVLLWRVSRGLTRRGTASEELSGPRRRSGLVSLFLALVVGVSLTCLAAYSARQQIQHQAHRDFDRLVDRLAFEIERRTNQIVYGLRGARGVYAASDHVSRAEFRSYVESRDLAREFPGVLGMGFIQRVSRGELESFIAAESVDEAPEFSVSTSGNQNDLYVIKFIEPLERNRPALGFDVGSDPVRRKAIEAAVRTGQPTMSARVSLVQDDRSCAAFLYLVPVYKNGVKPSSAQERTEALVGLVYAPLVIDDVFGDLAAIADGKLQIQVYDGEEGHRELLLERMELVAERHPDQAMFHEARSLRVGGREWSLMVHSHPTFESSVDRQAPAYILGGGSLLSVMLASVIWSLRHRRTRALELAQQMTLDLTVSKERAESMARELQMQSGVVEVERERLELALSGAGLGSWDWNPQTGDASFDERWAAIVGEVMTRPHVDEWLSRIHADDASSVREKLDAHFTGDMQVFESEHRLRHRDRTWRWVINRGIVVSRDAEGRPTRMVGTQEDCTLRKESEAALARERSRLATFIEHAPAAVAMFDREMRYIAVSNRWVAEYRLGSLDVLGLSHYDVFPEMPDRWKEVHRRCLAGAVEQCEDDPWRPEGWHFDQHLRWEVRPWYEPDESIGGLVMFTQDITDQVRILRELERRGSQLAESEKRFRTLVEGTEVIVWEYDAEREAFTYVSPQALKLGYPLEDWLTPKFWEQHLHELDRVSATEFCRAEVAAKRHHRFQYRMLAADGRVMWMDDFASVEESARGTPLLRGVFVDITDRKNAEEAMLEARQAADAANHAKSEFLANMSHEIRTPLTAILGYTDLLRDDGDMSKAPERRLQTIDTIRNAGNHLLTIINDILDISKIEAGKMTIETVETPIVRVLAEVESLVRSRAEEKGVRLELELETPLPERVMSDPTRLRQILMNLAGNAVKFTSAGCVRLVSRTLRVGSADRVQIDVIDTGAGMSPEQAERLFAPFTQADSTVTRQHGGTGLGLTISRRLARLMGGDVVLERTEKGVGSCFRVDLPLVAALGARLVNDAAAVKEHAPVAFVSTPNALSGRILLAEDGPDNQRLISFHLKKAGASVDVAENGLVAIQMIESAQARGTPYDLLVTDMQMPEMDGYSLARTLRARQNMIAIIALTAHAMAEDHSKCLEAGCDAYATKPIDKGALLSLCARWIGKPGGEGRIRYAA